MNEELNTRLFSFDELVNKTYINLLNFSQNLQENCKKRTKECGSIGWFSTYVFYV